MKLWDMLMPRTSSSVKPFLCGKAPRGFGWFGPVSLVPMSRSHVCPARIQSAFRKDIQSWSNRIAIHWNFFHVYTLNTQSWMNRFSWNLEFSLPASTRVTLAGQVHLLGTDSWKKRWDESGGTLVNTKRVYSFRFYILFRRRSFPRRIPMSPDLCPLFFQIDKKVMRTCCLWSWPIHHLAISDRGVNGFLEDFPPILPSLSLFSYFPETSHIHSSKTSPHHWTISHLNPSMPLTIIHPFSGGGFPASVWYGTVCFAIAFILESGGRGGFRALFLYRNHNFFISVVMFCLCRKVLVCFLFCFFVFRGRLGNFMVIWMDAGRCFVVVFLVKIQFPLLPTLSFPHSLGVITPKYPTPKSKKKSNQPTNGKNNQKPRPAKSKSKSNSNTTG